MPDTFAKNDAGKKTQLFNGRVIVVQQMKVNEVSNAHKPFDVLDVLDLWGETKEQKLVFIIVHRCYTKKAMSI